MSQRLKKHPYSIYDLIIWHLVSCGSLSRNTFSGFWFALVGKSQKGRTLPMQLNGFLYRLCFHLVLEYNKVHIKAIYCFFLEISLLADTMNCQEKTELVWFLFSGNSLHEFGRRFWWMPQKACGCRFKRQSNAPTSEMKVSFIHLFQEVIEE